MKTFYVRNVPAVVAAELERAARAEGLSLNAFLVRELTERSKWARAAAILDALPPSGDRLPLDELVDVVRRGRGELPAPPDGSSDVPGR